MQRLWEQRGCPGIQLGWHPWRQPELGCQPTGLNRENEVQWQPGVWQEIWAPWQRGCQESIGTHRSLIPETSTGGSREASRWWRRCAEDVMEKDPQNQPWGGVFKAGLCFLEARGVDAGPFLGLSGGTWIQEKKTDLWELYSRSCPGLERPLSQSLQCRGTFECHTHTHTLYNLQKSTWEPLSLDSWWSWSVTACNPEHQLSGPSPFRSQGNASPCFFLYILETQVISFRSMGVWLLSLQ